MNSPNFHCLNCISDTYLTHALCRAIYISYLFIALHYWRLFESIPEIYFWENVNDPGQITYLTQKTEDNTIVEDKKLKTDKKFS